MIYHIIDKLIYFDLFKLYLLKSGETARSWEPPDHTWKGANLTLFLVIHVLNCRNRGA